MAAEDHLREPDKYIYSRGVFRDEAKAQFFAEKHARPLVDVTNEYVSGVMFAGSGEDISSLPHADYTSGLVVSFTRTHCVIMDLVMCSELIDAATLLRKQFELIARLEELSGAATLDHLLEKTPNLRALKTDLKKLYGEYSKIAHSSDPEPLGLLGTIEQPEGDYAPLYPIFSNNSYVALNHTVLCVMEYYLWAHPFALAHWPKYDVSRGEEWLLQVVEVHKTLFKD